LKNHPEIGQTGQRLLRHPRPHHGRGAPDGGGWPEDHRLNIGNMAPFGFDAPEEIQQDMIRNLPTSAGYSDSKGIFGARKAVMHDTQQQGIKGVTLDDIYLGNGASELIHVHQRATGRWRRTAAAHRPTTRCGRRHQPVGRHAGALPCATRPMAGCPTWTTSAAKITPRTKGIVVINPNNPTGALYSDELLKALWPLPASMVW
jgi:alanine-synthesizing transaminase